MKTLRYLPILLILFWACSKDNDPAPANETKVDSVRVSIDIFNRFPINTVTLKLVKPSNKYDTITRSYTYDQLINTPNYIESHNRFSDTIWIYKNINQVILVNTKNDASAAALSTLKVSDNPYTKILIDKTSFEDSDNKTDNQNHKFVFNIK